MDKKDNLHFSPFKLSFLISAVAFAQDLFLYPLDTLNTRIKSYEKNVTLKQEIKKTL